MTTNMRAIIAEAFEAGRVAERELVRIAGAGLFAATSELKPADMSYVVGETLAAPVAGNGGRKRRGRVAKAAKDIQMAPKAPGKASKKVSVARKADGHRAKGVKDEIVKMIASEPMTAAAIIERTGFKATSVRATLMSLKKDGIAAQGDMKTWLIADNPLHDSGNSEGASLSA